jgi:large-conductance mechanosensitive channel
VLKKTKESKKTLAPAEEKPSKQDVLLAEIRDLLKSK